MPDDFSMVICDGPPGDTRGGRYGLLPIMKEKLSSKCIILLDDADRVSEQEVAARWSKELNIDFESLGSRKPYIKIRVGNP